MKPAGCRCGRRAGSFQLGKKNDITTWHWHIWHIFYISMHQTEFWTRRNLMANAFFVVVCGGFFCLSLTVAKNFQHRKKEKVSGIMDLRAYCYFSCSSFLLLPLCRLGSFLFSPSPCVIPSWWGSSIFQRRLPGMPALVITGHHSPSSAVVAFFCSEFCWMRTELLWSLRG